MPFARAFCDLLEEMKSTRAGQPELPVPVPAAVQTFELLQEADPSLWRAADLPSVFNYLRQSKRLKIPVEWAHLIPAKI